MSLALYLPSFAGTLNVSGRAGIYTPNEAGANPSIMYGLGAEYGINSNFSVRAAVETTSYTVSDVQHTYTPITVDLIYNQTIGGIVTPYLGAGVSYNNTTVGGNATQTTGVQAEAGVKVALGGLNAGFEVRYLVPDTKDLSRGSTNYNGYATGSFSQSFNI